MLLPGYRDAAVTQPVSRLHLQQALVNGLQPCRDRRETSLDMPESVLVQKKVKCSRGITRVTWSANPLTFHGRPNDRGEER